MSLIRFIMMAAILSVTTMTASAADPLKVAFVYSAPIGDGGWNFAHEKARREVQAKFGNKTKTMYVEAVADGADSERVMRDLISQGANVLVGTSFGYMGPMLNLSGEHSAVKFEHVSGYKTSPNMRVVNSRIYEGYYLAGIVAGSMTKSNILGFVGAVPIPEVIRNIRNYVATAQGISPAKT